MSDQTNIYWQRTKMGLKFVWRHFLTIPAISLLIVTMIAGSDMAYGMLFFTLMAMVFDHIKCNKSTWRANGRDSSFDDRPLTTQQWWNSSMMGTTAYYIDQIGKK